MKILMITPFYYPIIGGTESVIENISINLNKIGTFTDIMTFSINRTWKPWSIHQMKKGKIEKVNGVNVIKIPALTFLPTRILFRANFIPGQFTNKLMDYDILHFHNDVDLSFPLFSFSINRPKILHCHCLDVTYGSYRRNPLHRSLLKRTANTFIVPSVFFLKSLVNLGISREKIVVIPNGIDIEKFHPSGEIKIKNLLLFVGRIHKKKGLTVLLKSLKFLRTCVKLVIIGPLSQPWFLKEILLLIKEINDKTGHRVVYLGAQKIDELIKWYQRASILLCPSIFEVFPVVILEAMSCATPVVATNVGGIPEVVRDHKNGILVPPNDAVKLAESIQYLLDNEKVRRKFGEEGRKWMVKNFSSETTAKKLCQIYGKLI